MEKPPQNQLSVTPATPTASPTTGATKPILKAGANGLLPSLNSIPSLSLPSRFGVDLVAAGTASLLVSPIICIIDKGIIENASGKRKLVESMRYTFGELVRRPHRFVAGRPFRLIYMLYFGTYLTANSIDTVVSTREGLDVKTVTAGKEKFLATTGVNMGLCLYKDRSFARIFGTISPRPLPLPSYLLFSTRDTLTIFFSFNIPPVVAPYMPQDARILRPDTYAQLLAPAACQLFSTPLHLLGLDLYNRGSGMGGEKVGWRSRWDAVRTNWASSAVARMGRIIPAFGFGGVTNAGVRRSLLERFEQRGA